MSELALPADERLKRSSRPSADMSERVRQYWNRNLHDLEITTERPGTPGFFKELEQYRYEKLAYLPALLKFEEFRDQRILEIGCGVGIDLARFVAAGASATGIDLSEVAVELARAHFEQKGLSAELDVMNGEALDFEDGSFDCVYVNSVLQYAPDPSRIVEEMHRVLRPGGLAIVVTYNRYSWLNYLSKLVRVDIEHRNAPVLRLYSAGELRTLLAAFADLRICYERFPVKTRLHSGIRAALYNELFVPLFSLVPKPAIKPLGWHLIAFGTKGGLA